MKKYTKTAVKPGPMIYPLPVAMVSCGNEEENNIITAAWTGIINTNPPMTYVSVMKSRYSHDIIAEHGEFVINLVDEETAAAMDYCGVKSGRDVDKWKEAGLTPEKADCVSAPMIKESPVSLECKVFEVKELPSHDMFMAEIVAVHIADDYIDESGAYRIEDMGLVTSCHGKYKKVEKRTLGFFGFSIMKDKTRRRREKEAAGKRRSSLRGRRKSGKR